MKSFWRGFNTKQASLSFKKHQIVLYWAPPHEKTAGEFKKIAFRYPTVQIKVINVAKHPSVLMKHALRNTPTVVLMKNGREVDRTDFGSTMLIEQLFRRAGV